MSEKHFLGDFYLAAIINHVSHGATTATQISPRDFSALETSHSESEAAIIAVNNFASGDNSVFEQLDGLPKDAHAYISLLCGLIFSHIDFYYKSSVDENAFAALKAEFDKSTSGDGRLSCLIKLSELRGVQEIKFTELIEKYGLAFFQTPVARKLFPKLSLEPNAGKNQAQAQTMPAVNIHEMHYIIYYPICSAYQQLIMDLIQVLIGSETISSGKVLEHIKCSFFGALKLEAGLSVLKYFVAPKYFSGCCGLFPSKSHDRQLVKIMENLKEISAQVAYFDSASEQVIPDFSLEVINAKLQAVASIFKEISTKTAARRAPVRRNSLGDRLMS